jgi:hypothetical protein
MTCSHCANDIPDGSKFCNHCGTPPQAQNAPKSSFFSKVIPVLVVVLLALLVVRFAQNQTWASRSGTARLSATVFGPQLHQFKTVDSAVVVRANSLSWYPFAVPPNATQVSLLGHFTATGGLGNDIECYVLDEDGLANLKNRHSANTFFNSGKVTQAKIAAILPPTPGTYYLVLDNRFSLITPKAVQVEATVSYMQ